MKTDKKERAALLSDEQNNRFREIYARNFNSITAYIKNRCQCSRDEAEDLTQTVMLSAYEKWAELSLDESKAEAWLFLAATNASKEYNRKKGKILFIGDKNWIFDHYQNADPPPEADSEDDTEELKNQIRKRVSRSEWEIIRLKLETPDITPEEIARRIGSTSGAVQKRLERAQKKLKDMPCFRSALNKK